MNVFSKRPLSLILCIMLGVFYLFSALASLTAIFILLGVTLLGVVFIFFIKPTFKHRTLIIAVTVCVLISGLFGQLYFKAFFPDFGTNKEITALITEVNEEDYHYSLTLKCESIDGRRASNKLLYNRSKSEEEVLAVGDKITLRCTLSEFESGGSFDAMGYYVGKGYSARAERISYLEIVSRGNYVFSKVFTDIRAHISERLERLCNEDAAGLLSALVVGERDGLNSELRLGFSRIGISHILALSGMHIAILCAAISKLLALLRLNKKIRIILTSLFTVAYMILTGMSYSVVRAGAMLLISSLLFLLSLSRDSFTTLISSVFLIILVEPYAIYDVSLALSAFATLGILVYSEYTNRKNAKKAPFVLRAIRGIGNLVFASVFAVGATYLITSLRFSFFSTLAVFSTLIFSFIVEIFVYVGLIMLALGAGVLSPVINGIYEFIEHLTNLFSSFKYASVSFSLPFIKPLIVIFSILLFLFIVLKIKRKRAAVGVLLILFCAISALGIAESAIVLSHDEFTIEAAENADIAIVTGKGEASVVYSGSLSEKNAAATVSSLYFRGITYIDNIVINNYADGLSQYLDSLLGGIKCERIYLPLPTNDEELAKATYATTLSAAVKFYENEEAILLGNATLHHLLHNPLADNYKVQNVYTVRMGDKYSTYVSSGYTERAYLLHPIIYETDVLIIGSHGQPFGKNYRFDLQLNSVEAIYFLAEIKLDERTRDFYNKKGVPIYN